MQLPSYWLRYSEGVVVEIIEATALLLSCSYSNPNMLGPVHYMALFDPKATWFRKWTVCGVLLLFCLSLRVSFFSMGRPAGV